MLKGDLTSTPLAPLLLDLAADSATGCLSVSDGDGDEALVYLKGGLIYAIAVPGSRPQLGAKLVSSGALAPEALAEALDAQRTELQGWRLGELLVHLGYVDQPVVEAFVKEQVHEALWDLLRWSDGRWRFRKNSKTREDVGPPMIVVELLESLRDRGYEWETISAVVHGPHAVPMLSARGDSAAETTLDNDAWSMLCKIDGQRTVAELARDCGYTLFEAGHVIVSLVQAGLVDIEERVDVEGAETYGASTVASALAADRDEAAEAAEDEDALTKLAKLVTEVAGGNEPADGRANPFEPDDAWPSEVATAIAPAQRPPEPDFDHSLTVPLHGSSAESFAASIARVSGALADVLGPPQEVGDDIDPLLETRKVQRLAHDGEGESEDDEWDRRRRLRSAAAAELVNAQALADALRPDRNTTDDLLTDEAPRLIDEAKAAEHAREQAERHAAEEAAREAAERFAQAAAEEASRSAREAEERSAREAEERSAAEVAERLAAEEATRLAAEVEAAEVEAWAEYWHREEDVRTAREEAERVLAELAAQEETERVAAEQAARLAAEAVERQAAEDAERQAAEQAAREEADRVAAEQAAREEADRVAAEQAAREEADRVAAEQAAREEAERKAAEKAERAARRKAEKAAAAEAARREDEAAAAHAMLIELNSSAAPDEPAAPPVAPAAEVEPEPVPVGVGAVAEAPTPSPMPEYADTAALLRELSSLGTEEEAPPAMSAGLSAQRAARNNAVDEKKPRKKIGLFGL